jgi:hypothetical protein
MYLFSRASRPNMGPTQPPIQGVNGDKADGVYNRPLIPFNAKDKNARSYILPYKPSWHGDYLSMKKNTALY